VAANSTTVVVCAAAKSGANLAEKVSRPGRCGLLAPAHPPGASRCWDHPPLVDLRALAFARPTHRPSCPKAWRAMPMLATVSGCPAPQPMAPLPVARQRCPFEPVLSANRPPFPKLDPAPVARTSIPAPFTLTRLPVPSFRWRLRTEWFLGSSWGAPVASAGASLPVAPGKPVTRCTEAAPPLAAPVARCSSLWCVASCPTRSRLRLVNRSRFPPRSARRRRSEDSVIRSRLACAPRYVGYLRGWITPGQGVFLNPQGYPRTFSSIPRNLLVVHRSFTGMSPDLRPRRSDFVDGTTAFGVEWQPMNRFTARHLATRAIIT
jgi:hypothetical protein